MHLIEVVGEGIKAEVLTEGVQPRKRLPVPSADVDRPQEAVTSATERAARRPQAQAEGLIGPIDAAKVPNLADVDPALVANQDLNPGGALHGVPWTWGLTSFAVNTADFPEPPTSVNVFWDPALKGRVSIRDDALEAVQFAALATGQNINDITDMEAVKAKLTELKGDAW